MLYKKIIENTSILYLHGTYGRRDGQIDINDFISEDFSYSLIESIIDAFICCLLYTSPSPRDRTRSRMPSSA